jgi:hypothetical protein
MREAIERRIEEFLADSDPRFEWVRRALRMHRFLPLYFGWFATLGIRPDASFVRWDHEENPDVVRPLDEPYWQRLAIGQGAKRYPELTALIPPRTPDAVDCEPCKGTGEIILPIVCKCGGLGWVVPGEDGDGSVG